MDTIAILNSCSDYTSRQLGRFLNLPMRTITRSTEQDEYDRNIKFLQRLHKPLLRTFSNLPMKTITRSTEQDEYGRDIKFLQRLHTESSLRAFFEPGDENNNKINGT